MKTMMNRLSTLIVVTLLSWASLPAWATIPTSSPTATTLGQIYQLINNGIASITPSVSAIQVPSSNVLSNWLNARQTIIDLGFTQGLYENQGKLSTQVINHLESNTPTALPSPSSALFAATQRTTRHVEPGLAMLNASGFLNHDQLTITGATPNSAGNLLENPVGQWLALATYLPRMMPTVPLNSYSTEIQNKIKNGQNYRDYAAILYNTKIQSQTALSSLLHLILERIPQPELGNRSQLALQTEQANFRMVTPTWRNAMATASNRTLAKETLYLLAEIRQELHQTRKTNERILASMALMQAQLSQTSKFELDQLAQRIKEEAGGQ